jgi:phosphate ABC transporter permease subunit PstA
MNSPIAAAGPAGQGSSGKRVIDHVNASLKRRYAAERRFRAMGMAAVALGLLLVVVLFADIVGKGYTAFQQTYIQLSIAFDPDVIDPEGRRDPEALQGADYAKLVRAALKAQFPEVTERQDVRALSAIMSPGALAGTFYTLLLTLVFAFPVGVGAALYLEEFAAKNRLTDFIEVNINNLAAVPSIVFGLLGLAVFINLFGVPRSTPLIGALVLALMTLPTIIIASRAALKSVPPSIREAALGVGASPLQAQFHHVIPLAMPGMLTGAILGMARALGETAPLLMIGMIAFIVDVPHGITDPATVLPVQIYLWADSPEMAFVERTSAAIMVLLAFLITMNLTAVLLRRRFERRW